MDFVNEIDFAAALCRGVLYVVKDLPGIVDPRTRCGIDLQQVEEASLVNALAGGACPAGTGTHPPFTVHRFGQQPGKGGLSYTSGPGKQKGMMNTVIVQRTGQHGHYMVLADDFIEASGSPFPGQRQITHQG